MERESYMLLEDIVVEILCRLHKKSLDRFKCVSKHWLALVFDRTRVFPKTSHAGLVCQTFLPLHRRPKPPPPPSTNDGINRTISQMNFLHVDNMGNASSGLTPSHLDDDNFFIITSCDGFLRYRKEQRTRANLNLVVFRPATNRSWNVSVSFLDRALHLGLASDGHHFKFAHFWLGYRGIPASGQRFFVDVFSTENEEWIQKQCHLPSVTIPRKVNKSIHSAQSVFLDGSFHWIRGRYLVIYRLGAGNCKLLELPPFHYNSDPRKWQDQCIWESEGCVNYCYVYSHHGGRICIWKNAAVRKMNNHWNGS